MPADTACKNNQQSNKCLVQTNMALMMFVGFTGYVSELEKRLMRMRLPVASSLMSRDVLPRAKREH